MSVNHTRKALSNLCQSERGDNPQLRCSVGVELEECERLNMHDQQEKLCNTKGPHRPKSKTRAPE